MKQYIKKQAGLTLVELLIVMGMISIFMVMLTDIFAGIGSAKLASQATSAVTEDGRAIMARLEYDISRASSITVPENLAVTTSSITATTATIGWTTIALSDSQVQYGLTTSYGSSSTLNPSMVTAHSVNLTGLTNATTYHFRVLSRDAAGSLTTSADYTFTTGSAAPTHVRTANFTNDGQSSTAAATFSGSVAAGNLIVASVSWDYSLGASLVGCSDNLGNIYSVAVSDTDATFSQALAICYAPNVAAGSTTVTATFSNSQAQYRRLIINEYSGIQTSSPVDVTAKNIANGTTAANNITSTAATTTTAGDLIFGAVMDDDSAGPTTITAGTGFTQRNSVNNKDLAVQDLVQGSAGSVASTQTFGAARRYLAQMVAFKAASNTQPAKLGATSQRLLIVIGGVTNIYEVVSGNLRLTNGSGTNNLNGSETVISNPSFQRLGNIGGSESIRASFTVTSVTVPEQGPKQQTYTLTAGRR